MKSSELIFDQELNQIELRIARRADELVRLEPDARGSMPAWEQAEQEVLTACLCEIAPPPPGQPINPRR